MSTKTKTLQEPISHLDLVPFATVEHNAPLKEAYETMQRVGVGCVLVVKGRKLVGLFTERDMVLKALGLLPLETPVERAMTSPPVTVHPKTTVGEAVELMYEKGFRNLPLVDDDGKPAGLLTVQRIIKYLAGLFPVEVYNLPPKPGQLDDVPEGA